MRDQWSQPNELQTKICNAQQKYPNIRIIWNRMTYENIHDPNECYVRAVSNFEMFGITVEPGDLIFPLEGDVFFHINDIALLDSYIKTLTNNSGLQAPYLDFIDTNYGLTYSTITFDYNVDYDSWQHFIENQHYVEAESLDETRIHKRRIVIKFGTWDYYKNIVSNFTSQKYPRLELFPRYVFHYAWWRPGKYKDLRFRQLIRPDHYSNAVRQALSQAQENRLDKIVIRPDRHEDDLLRYIVRIDIDHPTEIKQHNNFI